jgi:hypothetical protein
VETNSSVSGNPPLKENGGQLSTETAIEAETIGNGASRCRGNELKVFCSTQQAHETEEDTECGQLSATSKLNESGTTICWASLSSPSAQIDM